jgi:hypothetical protein
VAIPASRAVTIQTETLPQVGGRTYKVHLDGYNQLPYLTGQQEKSDRKGFDDDGHVVAVRYANWKIVFAEQKTQGTLDIWGEPFTFRRFPLIFNLRMDPYERAEITSNQLLGLDDPQGIFVDGSASDRRAIHRYVPRIPTGTAASELQRRPDHGEIAATNERLTPDRGQGREDNGARVNRGKRGPRAWAYLSCLIMLVAPDLARAQLVDVPDNWGGDILSRPRLTGDWARLRDDLAQMGVVFDIDLLGTPQAVVSGGRSTGSGFWGNVDYTLNIDTQKLGLWPGGFFKFQGDTGLAAICSKMPGQWFP